MQKVDTVEEYIETFPREIQERLHKVRSTIKQAIPDAVETISYGMPAYKFNGKPVAYFAAFAKHIGFYATPNAHEEFVVELAKYKQGKGSVQFPLDQPVPLELISKMVSYNVERLSSR